MALISLIGSILLIGIHVEHSNKSFAHYVDTPMIIHSCSNFVVTGKGDDPQWNKASWVPLAKIDKSGAVDSTKYKVLYSSTGIYVLFQGADEKLNSAYANDFDNLFNADVFEVFFHPYPQEPVYFEYEISPLEKELVLLILNRNGKFGGWTPWHYEGENKVGSSPKSAVSSFEMQKRRQIILYQRKKAERPFVSECPLSFIAC